MSMKKKSRVAVCGYSYIDGEGHQSAWAWDRFSPNGVYVASSARSWPERRHAVRAARVEAELTGARLVIEKAS